MFSLRHVRVDVDQVPCLVPGDQVRAHSQRPDGTRQLRILRSPVERIPLPVSPLRRVNDDGLRTLECGAMAASPELGCAANYQPGERGQGSNQREAAHKRECSANGSRDGGSRRTGRKRVANAVEHCFRSRIQGRSRARLVWTYGSFRHRSSQKGEHQTEDAGGDRTRDRTNLDGTPIGQVFLSQSVYPGTRKQARRENEHYAIRGVGVRAIPFT